MGLFGSQTSNDKNVGYELVSHNNISHATLWRLSGPIVLSLSLVTLQKTFLIFFCFILKMAYGVSYLQKLGPAASKAVSNKMTADLS